MLYIFCANCAHCLAKRREVWRDRGEKRDGTFVGELRVRCAMKHWPLRDSYSFHTILNRTKFTCPDYEPMGDQLDEFIDDLRESLPKKRVFTSPPKGVVLIKKEGAA